MELGKTLAASAFAAVTSELSRIGRDVETMKALPHVLEWTRRPFGGFHDDIARKRPLYRSDFRDGMSFKVLASTVFLLFACLANALAFGALTGALTGNQIGIVEMLLVTAVGGVGFALLAGQPLTILGGTGPITIFTGLLYTLCSQHGLPFLPIYAWVGIWSGLLLLLCAFSDASALMKYFTRFTDEVFAALISVIFIYEAVRNVGATYQSGELSVAFLSTILALGTFLMARTLKSATRTVYLNRTLREILSDFGPTLAIVALTGFSLMFPEVSLQRPPVPDGLSTTSGRPWLVSIFSVSPQVIFACLLPALMVTILLFLDQNITTRIVNSPDNRLRKGSGYHLDLAIVATIVLIGSLFGLPWLAAATVHSVNHLKSLAETEVRETDGEAREVIVSVQENRVSGLAIHLLMLVSLLFLAKVAYIPMAVLYGLFLYMGFASLQGNGFFERLTLWVTDPRLYPKTHCTRSIPLPVIHRFTMIQLLCFAALWAVKSSKLGILFPLMIAAMVPVRLAIERIFEPGHLLVMDAEDREEAEELHQG
jgi:hypothetical protein